MKRFCLIATLLFFVISCGTTSQAPTHIKAATMKMDVKHKRKSYTMVIKDKYGRPFWKFRVEYIGKRPMGKYKSVDAWKRENWDFFNIYEWRMFNAPVEMISEKKWFGVGTNRQQLNTKEQFNQTGVDRKSVGRVGYRQFNNKILPVESNSEYQGKLVEKNRSISHYGNAVAFHQVKRFRYRGDIYEFDLPLQYTKIRTLMFD